jgi:DNA-binding GntR family transcriptional regulator
VREALIKLASELLITFRPGRGFFSNDIDPQEQLELYELRFALLRHCIDFGNLQKLPAAAIPKISVGKEARSKRNGTDPAVLQKVAAIEDFCEHVAKLSNNSRVMDLVRNLNERTRVSRIIIHESPSDCRCVIDTMHEVSLALQAAQKEEAIKLLRDQLDTLKPRLPALIEQRLQAMYSELPPMRLRSEQHSSGLR